VDPAETPPARGEELYRFLINSSDDGFALIELILDAHDRPVDWRFLETNPAFQQQTGFVGIEWWRRYSHGEFAVEDVRAHPFTRGRLANYDPINVRAYAVQPYRREGEWTFLLAVTENVPRK